MFANKYPNTSRTVSGLTPVYNTDSILEVDTSTVAATINLDNIAQGYWNTTWKLYVFDKSNNASVHNITINAGTGQTINGQSSLVINQNGGGVLIRVISNTKFLASLTIVNPTGLTLTTTGTSGAATLIGNNLNIPQYSGGGGSNLEIKNQGTTLTPTATSIDFVGAGVSSTNIGTAVTVTINGINVVSLTNAALQTLISLGTVVAGQSYLVTDAPYDCVGVLLQGVTTKTVTENGNAIFYVADYQGTGNYSSLINAPTGFIGSWTTVVCPVAQYQVIVYNNRNFQNLTGVWGSAPDTDSTNWLGLAPSLTTGYFVESDAVLYNVATNNFIYREDKRGNKVTNYDYLSTLFTIRDFPWGNNKVTLNTVLGTSIIYFTNSNCVIKSNTFDGAIVGDITPFTSFGTIQNNVISSGGILNGQQLYTGGQITGNIISQNGNLTYDQIISGNVTNCTITGTSSVLQISGINTTMNLTGNLMNNGSILNIANCTNCSVVSQKQDNAGYFQLNSCSNQNFNGCEVSDSNNNTYNLETVSATYTNKKVYAGFSNWEKTFTGAEVVSGTIVTIPPVYSYVGIITLTAISTPTLQSIVNFPTNHPITLKPDNTFNFRIVPIAVGVANTNEIIETASTFVGGATTYFGRTNGCDEAILQKAGTFVGLTIKNIWI
jgi:hypothetical protein